MLPMEKATYRARAVRSAGFGESGNGNYQIAIECEVVEHDEFAGERISWVGTFTPNTEDRTIESLQIMGWKGDNLEELAEDCDISLLPDAFDLVCEPDEYEGKVRLKAQWVNRPGAGRFAFKKPLAGGDLKSFAAQMKSKVMSVRGGPSRSTQKPANGSGSKPARHPNAPGSNDDIPFAHCGFEFEPSPIAPVLR